MKKGEIIVDKSILAEAIANKVMLEGIVNYYLNNKLIPKEVRDKVVECMGTEKFIISQKGEHIYWKGLEID